MSFCFHRFAPSFHCPVNLSSLLSSCPSSKHQLLPFTRTFSSSFLMHSYRLFGHSSNISTVFLQISIPPSRRWLQNKQECSCSRSSAPHRYLYPEERTTLETQKTCQRINGKSWTGMSNFLSLSQSNSCMTGPSQWRVQEHSPGAANFTGKNKGSTVQVSAVK